MNFLRNIGADLVEKRLWPVALALIIGIVAVPTLLASSASDEATDEPAAAASAVKGETVVKLDTTPAGRRQRGGSSKNPFKQLFVPKATAATAPAEGAKSGADADSGAGNSGGGDSGTGTTDTTPKPKAKPKDANLDVYRVNLRFGQPGAMKSVHDVPRLTPLPSVEDPFFVYLGIKEDGETLVFLVSSDAKATGDGKCKPSDNSCETIEMKVGDTEMFDVTTEGLGVQQYQMDIVSIKKSKASSAKAARKARARHSKAGAALLTLAQEGADRPDLLGSYRWDPARGVLEVVAKKARASKVAVGPIAGTASIP